MNAVAAVPGKKKKPAIAIAVPYWVREFALIRWGVAALTCAVAVGVATVVYSNGQLRDASATRTHVQQVRDAAYARYADADNEKREIRSFQPKFIVMRDRGLVGDENRLGWLDAIRRIQEDRRLMPISYEIAPQQPVALEPGVASGDYQLHDSRMSLHMDLLHELDLFNFLEDLRASSYFALQDCTIKRLSGNLSQAGAPLLSADCTLNWLTLTPTTPGAGGAGSAVARRKP